MSEKLVDLEWLDMLLDPMSYKDAQEIITAKNKGLPTNEGYWRLPSSHEIWEMRESYEKGFGLREVRYMCRSSRIDGKVDTVDSDGKKLSVNPESLLRFFIVRSLCSK
ncbi:MAG: hypothetical protein WC827_03520 [Candidatus Paceibacterota bacterium]|jgi:hypothetical protein